VLLVDGDLAVGIPGRDVAVGSADDVLLGRQGTLVGA
jgi:hypothetical protein